MSFRRVRVACVVGTRPDAIKMAPVIRRLARASWCECRVLCTAQHRELLDPILALFGIRPDLDLGAMQPDQTLAGLASRLIERLDAALAPERPDALLAQGDTTTTLAAALCAFYRRVPFGHVEAGLRTGSLDAPFPEEMNRIVAGRIARWHFAPTAQARRNLLAEGTPPSAVHLTGNTVIDALLEVAAGCPPAPAGGPRLVLVTAHRRESFGAPLQSICAAVRSLADARRDIELLFPVHPNPAVRGVVQAALASHPRIRLSPPLEYPAFVAAMKRAHFVLTDSGGVQEEAPALGKPVLVLREQTERPEAVAEGVARLVGTGRARIVAECTRLLDDERHYAAMARGASPYGDGQASGRIAAVLQEALAKKGARAA